ncbi:MAG: glycoside hydrolase family 97 catalytic domain-containing protein, partial [Bacteroidota bacterium]
GDSLFRYRLLSWDTSAVHETWSPPYGTSASIDNHYRILAIQLEDTERKHPITLEFRLYDEGLAYRIRLDGPEKQEARIKSELGSMRFSKAQRAHWCWADYNTLEKTYQHTPLDSALHAAAPFTVEDAQGRCIAVYEAALVDYPMLSWKKHGAAARSYQVHLCPGADGFALKKSFPVQTPWRVVEVSDNAARLMESQFVLKLNAPPARTDWSWVKPIRYIGVWWEMHLGLSEWKADAGRHGATTARVKHYIDFAAANGIEGVLIEGWNTGWERWGQKEAFDFISSAPDLELPELVRYAREKGVEIIGHHETGGDVIAYEQRIDSAFAFYNRMGIRYVKTGYAGPVNPPTEPHHGQYMVNHLNWVMETAARYRIMLDVHESVIPSGLSRTWPNLMTFEAVRGMEWNAWSEGNSPDHACTLPFTRGLAGPMDYTPGVFDILMTQCASERITWNGQGRGETAVHSTLVHQLALPVVLYSPMQKFADLPENYAQHPEAFELMQAIPATWDESRVVHAEIGKCIVVARRRGNEWFLAAIASEGTQLKIPLPISFFAQGEQLNVVFCEDAPDAHAEKNPTAYIVRRGKVNHQSVINLNLIGGGGALYRFSPDTQPR